VLGPQLQDTSTIKTETKWKVSPVNNSKIVKIAFREFNRNGDIVEEMNYDKNGKLKAISEFTFTNGSKTEREISFANGDTSKILIYNYVIVNGRISQKITLDTSGNVIKSEEMIYDKNGNVIKLLITNANGSKNVIEYQNSYTNGTLTSRYTLENNGSVTQRDSIVYNIKDNYFEKITTDNKGLVYYTTGYTVDDKGRVREEVIKDVNGVIIEKYIYEFTYFN
jgi:hypothetical protein